MIRPYSVVVSLRSAARKAAVPGCAAMLFAIAATSIADTAASDLYRITKGTSGSHVEYHQVTIDPGKEFQLADIAGPGRITYFYITDDSKGHFYRGLVLKVYWDGESEPSVDVPLADFFGAVESDTIDYQSALLEINHYCYMSYIPMPFSRRARFVLANDGDQRYSRLVAYGIDYESDKSFASEKSRFHAAWRRSNPTKNSLHQILNVRGRGHYVGSFLQVNSQYKGWWGEGDTIFTIDSKRMTHTPGTEDEYGSCWAFEHTYSYRFSGYLRMAGGKNRMYRWYVANPVRFRDSLTVDIQSYRFEDHKQVPSSDDYTSVAYWYQTEPHRSFSLQPFHERVAPSVPGDYVK
jgi:hypothetical protein